MSPTVSHLKTIREKIYGALMIIFGILLWLGFFAAHLSLANQPVVLYNLLVVDLNITFFAIFVMLSAAWFRAQAFGNMVLLGPEQFPDLHKMVLDSALALGMARAPTAFLYNSNGMMNAFARRLLGGRYVFLTSALVEVQNDAQLKFVVGHEVGHHAAGHLNPAMNLLKLPGHIVPFLAPAYSRAREATCDRLGAFFSADAEASKSALGMLGCGCRRLNAGLNCEAFMAQERRVPVIFGFISEIFRTHPRVTRRMRAIRHGVTEAGVLDQPERGLRIPPSFRPEPAE